jgi:hypothetical protein
LSAGAMVVLEMADNLIKESAVVRKMIEQSGH